jgi:polysaccharide biosynthesis/export protein
LLSERVVQILFLTFALAFLAICGEAPDPDSRAAYVLEPGDEITVHSLQMKEMTDKTFRLDQEGQASLPLIGRVRLSGCTVVQAEELLIGRLKKFYIMPDAELDVSALHPESVSVIGAVGTPGIHQIKGRTTLLDALSAAGGVRGDAGPVVTITRRPAEGPIEHASARTMISGESRAEIDLKTLLEARNPRENVLVRPHDVISIPQAQVVYVIGNVRHPGGFPLGGKSDLSIIQALALAEGLDPRAAPDRARILRRRNGTEQQIAVNLKRVLVGKAEDLMLLPNDILFVPNSAAKAITNRTIEAAVQIGTGVAIFAH